MYKFSLMSNFEIMKRKFLLLRFIFSFPRGGREKLPRLIEIVGDRREIMARGGRQSPANGNYLLEPDEIRQRTIKTDIFPDQFCLVMTSVCLDIFLTVSTIFKLKILKK